MREGVAYFIMMGQIFPLGLQLFEGFWVLVQPSVQSNPPLSKSELPALKGTRPKK
jgi:hypothetical protein